MLILTTSQRILEKFGLNKYLGAKSTCEFFRDFNINICFIPLKITMVDMPVYHDFSDSLTAEQYYQLTADCSKDQHGQEVFKHMVNVVARPSAPLKVQ